MIDGGLNWDYQNLHLHHKSLKKRQERYMWKETVFWWGNGCFQKIHTIPYHGWHLGISREGGGFLDWNSEGIGGGGDAVWNSKGMWGWGGVQLWIQLISREKTVKASLEIADLLTFLISTSSTNWPRKQDADILHSCRWVSRWVVQQAPHPRGLKVDELVNWLIIKI